MADENNNMEEGFYYVSSITGGKELAIIEKAVSMGEKEGYAVFCLNSSLEVGSDVSIHNVLNKAPKREVLEELNSRNQRLQLLRDLGIHDESVDHDLRGLRRDIYNLENSIFKYFGEDAIPEGEVSQDTTGESPFDVIPDSFVVSE